MSDRYPGKPATVRRLVGWLVGGVLFAVCAVGVVVAYVVQVSGEGGDAPGATQAADDDGPAEDEEPCESAPFAPAFDLLPPVDELSEGSETSISGFRSWSCRFGMTDGSSTGVLTVEATVDLSPEVAATRFHGFVAGVVDRDHGDTYEDFAEGWDESFLSIDEEETRIEMWSWVLEDDLVVQIILSIDGEAADVDTQRAAVALMAENVRDVMRE